MKQPGKTSAAAVLSDEQATRLLMQLLAIPGPSGGERKVVEFLRQQLGKAGVSSSELKTDDAQRRSALGEPLAGGAATRGPGGELASAGVMAGRSRQTCQAAIFP